MINREVVDTYNLLQKERSDLLTRLACLNVELDGTNIMCVRSQIMNKMDSLSESYSEIVSNIQMLDKQKAIVNLGEIIDRLVKQGKISMDKVNILVNCELVGKINVDSRKNLVNMLLQRKNWMHMEN